MQILVCEFAHDPNLVMRSFKPAAQSNSAWAALKKEQMEVLLARQCLMLNPTKALHIGNEQ